MEWNGIEYNRMEWSAVEWNGVEVIVGTATKASPNPSVCSLLTSKCSSCDYGVHFFDINFQKGSGHGVFFTLLLQHVLRATPVCNFVTPQLPKALRM